MSTYTVVRALVRMDVAERARGKAETEQKTLAAVVAELLDGYVGGPSRRPRTRKRSE